jgi:hypothetical protein
MPEVSVHISDLQFNMMMAELDQMLYNFIVVDDMNEYPYLGEVTHGLTPRWKVNFEEQINVIIRNILNNRHPIITKRLVSSIIASLDSAMYALLSIRPKNTFTKEEIKTYLNNHLNWLLDARTHYPSLLGNYIVVDEENDVLPDQQ